MKRPNKLIETKKKLFLNHQMKRFKLLTKTHKCDSFTESIITCFLMFILKMFYSHDLKTDPHY